MICLELHNEYIWNYLKKKNEIFKVQKKKDILSRSLWSGRNWKSKHLKQAQQTF